MAEAQIDILMRAIDEASATLAKVRGETAALGTAHTSAAASATSHGNALKGLESNLIGIAGPMAAFIGGLTALSIIKSSVSDTQALGEAVRTLSMQSGLSAEQSSHYIFMLKETGLNASDAERALGIFAKGVDTHSKLVIGALDKIGVSATDASGRIRSVNDLLPDISDHFRVLADGSEKTAIAMELFGRSGKDMIPFLDLGSVAMSDMAKEADKLGVTLSAGNVAKIHQYTMEQRLLSEEMEGLKVKIGMELLPVLMKMGEVVSFVFDHWDEIMQGAALAFRVFVDIFTLGAAEIFYHWDAVWGAIGGPVVSAMDFVLRVIHDAVDKILALINKVIDGFNSIKFSTPEIVMPGGIPNIPGVSFGGMNIPNVPGAGGDWTVEGAAGAIGSGLSNFNDALDKYKANVPAAAVATEDLAAKLGGGGKAGGLKTAADTAADNLEALAQAFAVFHAQTGASGDAFIKYLDLQKKIEAAQITANARTEESTNATYGWLMAMSEIKLKLLESGDSVTEFLRKIAEASEKALSSAFGSLNSSQTVEGAALQLRIDQLTFQRDQLGDPNSPSGKAIQSQIDALNKQKTIMDDQNRIQKDLFDVNNKMLPTMQQKLFSEQLYIIAEGNQSTALAGLTAMASLEGIARGNLIAAMNAQTSSMGGMTGFNDAEKHWINGVAASKGEAPPYPGYAQGTPYVPQTGLALVHQGEQIIPAGQSAAAPVINVHIAGNYEHHGDASAGIVALAGMQVY